MAYDFYITRVSDLKLENPQRLKIPDWVDEDEACFKSIMRFGDLDKFAIFTKDEILTFAKDYEKQRAGSALNHLVEPNSFHAEAVKFIKNHGDAIYLVSAIFWESGMT